MTDFQFISVAGNELEYSWVGKCDASGAVVVFLHEGLGSISMWRDFPQKLCERLGLRGFVYSRAGYGGSDDCKLPRKPDYMHVEGLEVLPLVLQAAGIENAILVGHSDGGSIALLTAGCEQRSKISAIVTLAAHVFVEDVSIASITAARDAFVSGDLRSKLKRHHGENVNDTFYGWCDIWLHEGFRRWNMEENLLAIKVPSLILQGAQDPYGTHAQVEAIVAGIGEGAQSQIINECGHNPHLEQAKITIGHITDFVQSFFD